MVPPPGCRAACVLSICLKTPHHMHATSTTVDLASDGLRSPQGCTLVRFHLRGTSVRYTRSAIAESRSDWRRLDADARADRWNGHRSHMRETQRRHLMKGSTAWSPERGPFARM